MLAVLRIFEDISIRLLAAWLVLSAACAFAQTPCSLPRLSGTAGFGLDSRRQDTRFGQAAEGEFLKFDFGQREVATDLSLNTDGCLYHPKLVLYNVLFHFERDSTAIDERGIAANAVGFAGSVTFLPERSFGSTLYFERSGREGDGSLGLAFTSHRDVLGLRGRVKLPYLAQLNYNFGKTNTQETWEDYEFDVHQRFANLNTQGDWRGWNVNVLADYMGTHADSISQTDTTVTTLQVNGTRTFRDSMRLNLNARRVAYSYGQASRGTSSRNAVTALYGMLNWKHSPRLGSHYAFTADRNSVNTLALLLDVTGLPNPWVPLEEKTLESFVYSSEGGITYQATSHLSVGARMRYQGQKFDLAAPASSNPLVRAGLTTGEMRVGGDARYQRRLWKLDYQGSGWLEWQRFSLLLDGASSGPSWSTMHGITAGKPDAVRVQTIYTFSSRSRSVFFRTVSDHEHRLSMAAETLRFGAQLRGEAEINRGYQEWPGATQRLNRVRYALLATRGRVNVSASHSSDNANHLLFGPGSPLWQPGGSTGGVPLPPDLLHPIMFSKTKSDVIAATWEPRRRLKIEQRYLRFRYTLINGQHQENTNWQWDSNAQYELGRFTLVGGYIRGQSGRIGYRQHENRYYFRIRFPFKL